MPRELCFCSHARRNAPRSCRHSIRISQGVRRAFPLFRRHRRRLCRRTAGRVYIHTEAERKHSAFCHPTDSAVFSRFRTLHRARPYLRRLQTDCRQNSRNRFSPLHCRRRLRRRRFFRRTASGSAEAGTRRNQTSCRTPRRRRRYIRHTEAAFRQCS